MKPTASNLIRTSGLAAIAAGVLFIIMQVIHPPDELASVATARWAIVHYMGVITFLFGMLGVTGIYARQIEASGWLGLVGYLLFGLFFAVSMAFQFIEAFISPPLAVVSPAFVEAFMGLVTSTPSEINLGAIATVYTLTGFGGYVVGGLLFGLATLRAGVLPRWAGGLMAFAALSVLGSSLLTHPLDRILAVPMGAALVWLGYALWSNRHEQTSTATHQRASTQLRNIGIK